MCESSSSFTKYFVNFFPFFHHQGDWGRFGLPLTWTSVGDVETALFTITVGLGISGESVGITFLTQWMLPRAVFLGRVIACFVLFPTGTATQGILWFYTSRQTFTNVQFSQLHIVVIRLEQEDWHYTLDTRLYTWPRPPGLLEWQCLFCLEQLWAKSRYIRFWLHSPREATVSHCPLLSQPDISTELFWSREPHCSYKNNSFQVRNNTGIISN